MAVSVSVVTTNGITSAEYKWNQGGCDDMDRSGPLISNGRHFSYNFNLKVETGVFCPQYVILEHTTVVRQIGSGHLHLNHNLLGRAGCDFHLHRSEKTTA